MAESRQKNVQILEQGNIYFFYRPKYATTVKRVGIRHLLPLFFSPVLLFCHTL